MEVSDNSKECLTLILTYYVRVALATSDVQSILEIPATEQDRAPEIKLNQIAARNIRISLDKRIAFAK